MSPQLRDKDVVQDSVKCSAQTQVDEVSCSSLILHCHNPTVEGKLIFQAQFVIVKPFWFLRTIPTGIKDCIFPFPFGDRQGRRRTGSSP